MTLSFFNGPVQNGDFTFSGKPGKAVGIRIAEALNRILGLPPVPQLWNTVRLAGDLRYRRHTATAAASIPRPDFEAALIAAEYDTGWHPAGGTATDADDAVERLALAMLEQRLATGMLTISRERVQVCARCAHMTGTGGHACRSCGHAVSRPHTARHLVAERDPALPLLSPASVYASKRRLPAHLWNIAGNAPPRLILSRTREYGIDLRTLGLIDLVLDPRVGIHVAVLAAARRQDVDTAVMTTTGNAAANIAAYGQHFTEHDGLRLLYALHGHVPYDEAARPRGGHVASGIGIEARTLFETWFLPSSTSYAARSSKATRTGWAVGAPWPPRWLRTSGLGFIRRRVRGQCRKPVAAQLAEMGRLVISRRWCAASPRRSRQTPTTQRVEDPTVLALIADLLCTRQADRDGEEASEA